jgi:hypothetical protein
MLKSYFMRWTIGVIAFIAIVSFVRFRPWHWRQQPVPLGGRESLTVGFLPVT